MVLIMKSWGMLSCEGNLVLELPIRCVELFHLGSDPPWLKTVSMLCSRRNWQMLNTLQKKRLSSQNIYQKVLKIN